MIKRIKSFLKIIICLIIVIAFWSALMKGSPFYLISIYINSETEYSNIDKIINQNSHHSQGDDAVKPIKLYVENIFNLKEMGIRSIEDIRKQIKYIEFPDMKAMFEAGWIVD